MNADYLASVVQVLQGRGVEVESGLKPEEVANIENVFGFRFPPDLRTFLEHALPASRGFPNWRGMQQGQQRKWLDAPSAGIVFDVEHNQYWMKEWGPRSEDMEEAKEAARAHLARAPKLIPIYYHRYIPSVPHKTGNPILSVKQTDIICYGYDLPDYFANEFRVPRSRPAPALPERIELWSDLVVGEAPRR